MYEVELQSMTAVHQAHVGELAHVHATRAELAVGARRLEADAQQYVNTNNTEVRKEYEDYITSFQQRGRAECEQYLPEARAHAEHCAKETENAKGSGPGFGKYSSHSVLPRCW